MTMVADRPPVAVTTAMRDAIGTCGPAFAEDAEVCRSALERPLRGETELIDALAAVVTTGLPGRLHEPDDLPALEALLDSTAASVEGMTAVPPGVARQAIACWVAVVTDGSGAPAARRLAASAMFVPAPAEDRGYARSAWRRPSAWTLRGGRALRLAVVAGGVLVATAAGGVGISAVRPEAAAVAAHVSALADPLPADAVTRSAALPTASRVTATRRAAPRKVPASAAAILFPPVAAAQIAPPAPPATTTATSKATPRATATPKATPAPKATAPPKATPTPTATPKATPTPTATPRPTATPTPRPTATPKPTATPVPTATPAPIATATSTPVPTAIATPTAKPAPSPAPTATPAPSPQPT